MGLEGLIIGGLACCRDEHISGGLGGGLESGAELYEGDDGGHFFLLVDGV